MDSIIRRVRPDWKVGEHASKQFLRQHLISDPGLYTSPHLVAVRERIRINGAPLSEEDFTKFFFEVWDRLDANDIVCCISTWYSDEVTLMRLHREQIRVRYLNLPTSVSSLLWHTMSFCP